MHYVLATSFLSQIVTAQARKSVLTLTDLSGAQFSRESVTKAKEVAVLDRPYVKRAAIVGAESLPTVFYEVPRSSPSGNSRALGHGRKRWSG